MSLLIALALMTAAAPNIIDDALEHFRQVEAYQVTLKASYNGNPDEIKYYFKKPGFVRMEFIKPHGGAVLVYNPLKRKARLRPFGSLKLFVLTLSPESGLVKSPTGHSVDKSDIGELLKTVRRLGSKGKSEYIKDEPVGGRQTVLITVEGERNSTVKGVHRYNLWLDKKTLLPLKTSAYDLKGKLMEEVLMDDLALDPDFPDGFFDL